MSFYPVPRFGKLDSYIPTIRWVCRRARRDVEAVAERPRGPASSDYGGYCALTSYMVATALGSWVPTPLYTQFCASEIHAWVLVTHLRTGDQLIADPTYCQYNIKCRVYVGAGTRRHADGLVGQQAVESVRPHWPVDQNPFERDTHKSILTWVDHLRVPDYPRRVPGHDWLAREQSH